MQRGDWHRASLFYNAASTKIGYRLLLGIMWIDGSLLIQKLPYIKISQSASIFSHTIRQLVHSAHNASTKNDMRHNPWNLTCLFNVMITCSHNRVIREYTPTKNQYSQRRLNRIKFKFTFYSWKMNTNVE